jgi:hypothetical protein
MERPLLRKSSLSHGCRSRWKEAMDAYLTWVKGGRFADAAQNLTLVDYIQ